MHVSGDVSTSIVRLVATLLTIARLDLTHAVYFHTHPMYTSADPSQPASKHSTPEIQPYDITAELNQDMLNELSDFIMNIPELNDDPANLGSIQADYLRLYPEPAINPTKFETEVQQWHQFLIQAAQSVASSSDESLAYVCKLAAGLHMATTCAVTPHPMRLQAQTEQLFSAMMSLQDDAWSAFAMLHVRV